MQLYLYILTIMKIIIIFAALFLLHSCSHLHYFFKNYCQFLITPAVCVAACLFLVCVCCGDTLQLLLLILPCVFLYPRMNDYNWETYIRFLNRAIPSNLLNNCLLKPSTTIGKICYYYQLLLCFFSTDTLQKL